MEIWRSWITRSDKSSSSVDSKKTIKSKNLSENITASAEQHKSIYIIIAQHNTIIPERGGGEKDLN